MVTFWSRSDGKGGRILDVEINGRQCLCGGGGGLTLIYSFNWKGMIAGDTVGGLEEENSNCWVPETAKRVTRL